MEFLRTPDARFADLPDWPYAPNYVAVPSFDPTGGAATLRMHYVDAGPVSGRVVLCLHGQPTWSYLYRKMIPLFVAAGHRVVAPDLVGFGRSDKPTRTSDYDYARHVAWLRAFVEALELRDVTLVCQDWGGLLGLRVVAECPERFERVVASNTGLPDGNGIPLEAAPALRALYAKLPVPETMAEVAKGFVEGVRTGTPPFMYWQKHCADSPRFTPEDVMRALCPKLSTAEVAAYAAPFPDERHRAGARRFPTLVPILPDDVAIPDNRRAWEALRRFDKPFLTAFTDSDPVTKGHHVRFQQEIPGARNRPHTTIRGAGHFVQEDAGPELARITLEFMKPRRAKNAKRQIMRWRETPLPSASDHEASVRWLRDREIIKNLYRRYAYGVDSIDFELVRSIFHPDCVIEGTLDGGGLDAYLADLEDAMDQWDATMHFVGNQYVEIDGDRGFVESWVVAYHMEADDSPIDHLVLALRYQDEVVRVGDDWKVIHRKASKQWHTGPFPRPTIGPPIYPKPARADR